MKIFILTLSLLLCCSCIENSIDSLQEEAKSEKPTLQSLVARSKTLTYEDSLVIISKLQSDVDYLMMGRVVQNDSAYVLAIKKETALYLGVSEEVYNSYLDYVDRLNSTISN